MCDSYESCRRERAEEAVQCGMCGTHLVVTCPQCHTSCPLISPASLQSHPHSASPRHGMSLADKTQTQVGDELAVSAGALFGFDFSMACY